MKVEVTPNQELFNQISEEVSIEGALFSLFVAYSIRDPAALAEVVLDLIEELE